MSSRSLWRVRPYVRPHAAAMAAMLLAASAGIGAEIAIPLLIAAVIDGPIAHHDKGGVVLLAVLAGLLGIAEAATSCIRRFIQASSSTLIERQLRDDLYAHLQRLAVAFHDGWQSGQLLSRAMADLSTIRRFVGFGLIFLFVNSATFGVVLVLLFSIYWPLAIVAAVAIWPLALLGLRFERRYRVISRRMQDQEGDLTTIAEESAAGIRVLKAFGRAAFIGERFARQARSLASSSVASMDLKARYWAALDLVPNVVLALVLLGGALAVAHHGLPLGRLVAFITLVLMLVWPVESLGWILSGAQEASTAAARVFEVFDTEPKVADRPGALRPPGRASGHLRFRGVGFSYATGGPVLGGVDLDVAPGETLGLVGATGCGKTTLAALACRLYDVTGGAVEIDGHDVRDVELGWLRAQVGVAFEDTVLFSASVRENLLLGHPHATDEEVRAALELAQACFAYELPWGLDSRVGEQGLTLSGGQRQRLALARAVIGRPPVLVLDDPLSALDVHTEAKVTAGLARALAGTTALLAVHRPSTLALADRVAYLEAGRVAAVGTHHELMAGVEGYRAILSQEASTSPLREIA